MLWIFFMCTFKWSVLLNTWPQVLQGCGTNLPWCWWRTWRSSVHFKLKMRAHIAHWNLGPSGVWHMVYTESVLVSRFSLLVGEAGCSVAASDPPSCGPGQPWPMRGQPAGPGPDPESETREGVTVSSGQWCGDTTPARHGSVCGKSPHRKKKSSKV